MWLAFSAAFISMFYALIKFITNFYLEEFKEKLAHLQHELVKTRKELQSIQEKFERKKSRRDILQKDVARLNRTTFQLYNQLQTTLPPALHPQLDRCRSLHPQAVSRELKVLLQSDLVDEIAGAMEVCSLLLFHLPPSADSEQTLAFDWLNEQLTADQIQFHGPDEGLVFCFFSTPHKALHYLRQFAHRLPAESAAAMRASLQAQIRIAGIRPVELKQLLAGSLHQGRQWLECAPAGALLLDENTVEYLQLRDEVRLCIPDEKLYAFSWVANDGRENPC